MQLPGALFSPSSKKKKKKKKKHSENNSFYFRKWNFQKISYISPKESFSYISRNGTLHFPSALNIFPKKTTLKKFLIFWKTELKKLLILQKMELSYIFSKESFSYIPRNGSPEKIIVSENRTFLYFRKKLSQLERNFLIPSFKNLLYLRRELAKPENQKVLILGKLLVKP